MEVVDLIRTQLSGPVIERLGAAAGLDPSKSRDVANLIVPIQLQALADKARAPGGAPQLTGMLAQLGPVEDVPTLVEHPEATQELASVGESLVAQLFGGSAAAVAEEAARETAAPLSGVVKFMQTLLPLVIGLLARHLNDRGLGLNTAGSVLAGIAGTDQEKGLFTASPPETVPPGGAPAGATGQTPGVKSAATPVPPAPTPRPVEPPAPAQETAPATPAETIRRAFSGRNAERLGTAAGIRSSDAGRATTTIVPVLLAAMSRRAQAPGGGKHLLGIAEKNAALADPEVALADTPRLEMTGQSLLNDLLAGGLGRTVGQLGSAVGAPGANVQRLLAIVAPMLLGLFGRNAAEWRLNADGFPSFLSGVSGDLKAMLPAGMASLTSLLDTTPPAEAPAAVSPAPAPSRPAVGRTPPPTAPSPAPTVRLDTAPAVTNPPAQVQASRPAEPEPRRAFPWWIVLIILLLVALAVWYFFLRGDPIPTSLEQVRDVVEQWAAEDLVLEALRGA